MKTIADFVRVWEELFPPVYQEQYDNSGLLLGKASRELQGILCALDCTEATVLEAKAKGCNLILAHHPILFKGIKRLRGSNYVERTIMLALEQGIVIYAAHTNVDNIPAYGVNAKIAEKLGLQNCRPLQAMKGQIERLRVQVPPEAKELLLKALFAAGAGRLGNYHKGYASTAAEIGFEPQMGAKPQKGHIGELYKEQELLLEVLFLRHYRASVLAALHKAHPYEEVAYSLDVLENQSFDLGAGLIGELPESQEALAFLQKIKKCFACGTVKYTPLVHERVRKIAFCGGSGGFLLEAAQAQGAELFFTGDISYHRFFDAEKNIILADIGHYESEQYTIELFYEIISEKFPTFAVYKMEQSTNPVQYL